MPDNKPSPRTATGDIGQVARDILAQAVRDITGLDDAKPRPGQSMMLDDIIKQVEVTLSRTEKARHLEMAGGLIGEGPVGVGKSVVYLSMAAASAATGQGRSVISTESLALQSQIVDKDAPLVMAACEKVTGYKPQVSVLKGWGNYVCASSATAYARELATAVGFAVPANVDKMCRETPPLLDALADRLEGIRAPKDEPTALVPVAVIRQASTVEGDLRVQAENTGRADASGDPLLPARLRLAAWTLRQVALTSPTSTPIETEEGHALMPGDKVGFTGSLRGANSGEWQSVSVSSNDCPGAASCPFGDVCSPTAAKARAAESDIVVTNHTLLGIQAANDIPVVLSSKTLGTFDHIFVDEAHGLPGIVRAQGSHSLSAGSVRGLAGAIKRGLDDTAAVRPLLEASDILADRLEDELVQFVNLALSNIKGSERDRQSEIKIAPDADPLTLTGDAYLAWLTGLNHRVTEEMRRTSDEGDKLALRRLSGRIETQKTALESIREHQIGCARWISVIPNRHPMPGRRDVNYVAQFAPVDVSLAMRRSLWTRAMSDDEKDAFIERADDIRARNVAASFEVGMEPTRLGEEPVEDGPLPRYGVTRILLSGTMQPSLGRDVGLSKGVTKYPSPYEPAYANSRLFVPALRTESDAAPVTVPGYGDKLRFSTPAHRDWAADVIAELVEANDGHALILGATRANAQHYAQRLADLADGRWKVLSQWDGPTLRQQVATWKEDISSVLVGTRSLMTGVDAPGDTCSLVIVDRPARAASNPVDDARVEQLMDAAEYDKWTADRFVYVNDAGLLLEQAAGRLVRSISDSGLVAVLDPRLSRFSLVKYPEATRTAYMSNLSHFPNQFSDTSEATEWLRNRARKAARATAS